MLLGCLLCLVGLVAALFVAVPVQLAADRGGGTAELRGDRPQTQPVPAQVRDLQSLQQREIPADSNRLFSMLSGVTAAPDVPAGSGVQVHDLASLGVAVALADQLPVAGVSGLPGCAAARLQQLLRVPRRADDGVVLGYAGGALSSCQCPVSFGLPPLRPVGVQAQPSGCQTHRHPVLAQLHEPALQPAVARGPTDPGHAGGSQQRLAALIRAPEHRLHPRRTPQVMPTLARAPGVVPSRHQRRYEAEGILRLEHRRAGGTQFVECLTNPAPSRFLTDSGRAGGLCETPPLAQRGEQTNSCRRISL